MRIHFNTGNSFFFSLAFLISFFAYTIVSPLSVVWMWLIRPNLVMMPRVLNEAVRILEHGSGVFLGKTAVAAALVHFYHVEVKLLTCQM